MKFGTHEGPSDAARSFNHNYNRFSFLCGFVVADHRNVFLRFLAPLASPRVGEIPPMRIKHPTHLSSSLQSTNCSTTTADSSSRISTIKQAKQHISEKGHSARRRPTDRGCVSSTASQSGAALCRRQQMLVCAPINTVYSHCGAYWNLEKPCRLYHYEERGTSMFSLLKKKQGHPRLKWYRALIQF